MRKSIAFARKTTRRYFLRECFRQVVFLRTFGYCKPRGNGTKNLIVYVQHVYVHIAPSLYIITADLVLIVKKNARQCDSPCLFSITWEIIITMRNSTGIRDCNRNDLVCAIRLWKCARKGFAGKCICIRTVLCTPTW